MVVVAVVDSVYGRPCRCAARAAAISPAGCTIRVYPVGARASGSGPLGPQDARRAVAAGADGLQLSNHGGRQLDRAVPPADTIAAVREAVGPDVSLLVDSGIRHVADIAVALALGADGCAIGRAYLYGLMAGGEAGVDKALDILAVQFKRTLQLLGVRSVAELRGAGRELLVNE